MSIVGVVGLIDFLSGRLLFSDTETSAGVITYLVTIVTVPLLSFAEPHTSSG